MIEQDNYDFSFVFGSPYTCIYCGEPADTKEHLIPFSYIRKDFEGNNRRIIKGVCTYACRECNDLAGNRLFWTFEERVEYVRKRLKRRYRKYMKALWDTEEVNTLHGNLKKYVRGFNFENIRIRNRLDYATGKEFWDFLEQAREEMYLDDRIPYKTKRFLIPDDYRPSWE